MSRLVAAALVTALTTATLIGVSPVRGLGYNHETVVSDNPVNYTPHVHNGTVRAIAVVGQRVYVGGTFTTVSDAGASTKLRRTNLFAYHRDTGRVLDFSPSLDGAVETIAKAPDGVSIIVGGHFRRVNGTAQRSLAMLRQGGRRVSSFGASTNGPVSKLLVRGNRLVAGGSFSAANGVPRANLAVYHSATGAVDRSFNVPVTEGRTLSDGTVTTPSIIEMDANASGSLLAVIGNFRRVGEPVRQQIALIDLSDGAVTGWHTSRYSNDVSGTRQAFRCYEAFYTQMRDVEFARDGSYFVVVTSGGAPDRNAMSLCDTTTRWETPATTSGTRARETWKNCTGGDTLLSVAVAGAAVYVGGHQRWLDNCGGRDDAVDGAFAADGIGAINPRSGAAIRRWNPGRARGVGAEELIAAADGLYIGSDTTSLAGEYHARFGLFPRV
jgi:hypothetical protein